MKGDISLGNFGNSKKQPSEHVYADTVVWQCTQCGCWSRNEFIYVEEPICSVCKGRMEQVTKNIRIE